MKKQYARSWWPCILSRQQGVQSSWPYLRGLSLVAQQSWGPGHNNASRTALGSRMQCWHCASWLFTSCTTCANIYSHCDGGRIHRSLVPIGSRPTLRFVSLHPWTAPQRRCLRPWLLPSMRPVPRGPPRQHRPTWTLVPGRPPSLARGIFGTLTTAMSGFQSDTALGACRMRRNPESPVVCCSRPRRRHRPPRLGTVGAASKCQATGNSRALADLSTRMSAFLSGAHHALLVHRPSLPWGSTGAPLLCPRIGSIGIRAWSLGGVWCCTSERRARRWKCGSTTSLSANPKTPTFPRSSTSPTSSTPRMLEAGRMKWRFSSCSGLTRPIWKTRTSGGCMACIVMWSCTVSRRPELLITVFVQASLGALGPCRRASLSWAM
mmetsp:Transcript_9962/g.28301  ORF Transcript_9962/g.28301 Transcript_9962/m.28301 type:complete len:378 (+) Transcript_9962:285-1418(+)